PDGSVLDGHVAKWPNGQIHPFFFSQGFSMNSFLTWGRNPWQQTIATHVSWSLLWASLFAGLMFLVAHASYMILSAHRKRAAAETDALEAQNLALPEKITRHTLMARMFH